MQIRRLLPEDAPALRTLMLRGYRQHPDAFTSSYAERAAQPPDWWAWRLVPGERSAERIFGALDDGRLIGAAGWRREAREQAAHRAELFGMVVAPDARGRGVGRAIVEALLADMLATPGMLTVTLTVTDGNVAAERLYARCGFVRCGLEPMAVRVGEVFVAKATMWKRLDATGAASTSGA
jgi:RimJ/RimL family protein N-acetyltransferase